MRGELSALESGEHLAERKRLYQILHPETTSKGGKPGNKNASKNDASDSAQSFSAPRFTEDVAKKTGRSETQIKEDIKLANDIPADVRDMVRDTPVADNKAELKRLAKLEGPAQTKAAAALADGTAKGVSQWRLQERYSDRRAAALDDSSSAMTAWTKS